MASEQEYVNAAKIPPSKRTTEQQAMVDRGSNMQSVRNANFAATEHERKHGS